MVIRRKKRKTPQKTKAGKSGCTCGSCEEGFPHLRGFILMALGFVFLPISFGFFPEFDWVARGWPILLVLFGFVLAVKAAICQRR